MKKGDEASKKRAKELANSIKDRNQPPSIDAMNRIYDVVLNMNSLNSKPSGSEDLMEQVKREKKAMEAVKEREYQMQSNLLMMEDYAPCEVYEQ